MNDRIEAVGSLIFTFLVVSSMFVGFVTIGSQSAAADDVTSPDVAASSGNTPYHAADGDWTTIDASVEVGGDWDFTKAKVILENPTGSDELRLDGTVNGISQDGSTTTVDDDDDGNDRLVLTLTAGTATSESDWQEALRQVEYRNTNGLNSIDTKNREIRISLGDKLPLGTGAEHNGNSYSTGHYYDQISGDKTWTTADSDASNENYLGKSAYLVTFRSAEEDDFAFNNLALSATEDYWIGASDDDTEDEWLWDATGAPDGDIQFWQGESGGSAQNNEYNDWASGEPNDDGGEHYAQYYSGGSSGTWNDLQDNPTETMDGYVVEWGDSVDGAQFNDVKTIDVKERPSFSADETLPDTYEDINASNNEGVAIDSNDLFGDEFSDPDGDDLAGIVITNDAAEPQSGLWQYSTDGGSTWYDIDNGSLSDSNGLLVSNSTEIRFQPSLNFNGDPGKLTVYAVDEGKSNTFTDGSTRERYDTTASAAEIAENSNTIGITVTKQGDAPTADAGDDISVETGTTFSFDGSGSWDVDGQISSYEWDVNDDGTYELTGSQPDHNYSASGEYKVILKATDTAGLTDTDNLTVTVQTDRAPTADAGDDGADEGAIAFGGAPGQNSDAIRFGDGNGTTVELDERTKALGPATVDFDDDGLVELPYVVHSGSTAGNLQLIDAEGETETLVAQGQNSDGTDVAQSATVLGVGSWNGSATSVFYVDKPKATIYRVTPDQSPTAVASPDDGAGAMLGVADVDGDGPPELVFADSSQTIQYIDSNGSVVSTGVTVGANNGIGAGTPTDFDGDGTAEVPIVDGSNDVALVDSDGARTLTSGGPAEKAAPAPADVDRDGDYELAFVTPPDERVVNYVDDVGGDNDVVTEPGYAADDRTGLVPSASGAAADKTVQTGTQVTFDGTGSSATVGVDSYEWDLDGDGTTDATGDTVSRTYQVGDTYTVRLTVTDGEGRADTDTYTLAVERPQGEIDAGLAPKPTYHANLANTGNYIQETGPKSTPEVVWKEFPLNSVVASQPVLAGETVYTGVHNPGPLHAFAAESGTERWTFQPTSERGDPRGITWSAPTVEDGTVYVGTNAPGVQAVDAASGETLGHYPTQGGVRSAPAVKNGTVYFGVDAGRVIAVDAAELRSGPMDGIHPQSGRPGDELWSYDVGSAVIPVSSNPAVVNGTVFVGADAPHRNEGVVLALDAESGAERWRIDPGADVKSDPTVVEGTVFVGTAAPYRGDGQVLALDADSGDEDWSHAMAGDVAGGQAYADGVVYAGSRGGDFVALDAADGSVIWEHSGQDFYGAPIVADGVVYVNDYGAGTVHAFDAETGDELWAFDSPTARLYGTPNVHDGMLYYGSGSAVYAIGQPSITMSDVNVTNPDGQTVDVSFETSHPAEDIEATVSGVETATLTDSDFEQIESIEGSYTYEATYEGSSYGIYNVSVTATGTDNETATGEDGVQILEPFGLQTSGGAATFDPDADPVPVDPDLVVTGTEDEPIEGAKVIVDSGHSTDDTLAYDTGLASDYGISGTYDRQSGILEFAGDGSPSEYQALLRTVTYETDLDGPPGTAEREISFSIGGRASYSAATDHYYEYVEDAGITWPDARDAGAEMEYFGQQGYLATVTSEDENDFVASKVRGDGWTGASDAGAEGTWRWVTGPEGQEAGGNGRHFFTQTGAASTSDELDATYDGQTGGGGTSVGGEYEQWASGEPNDWSSGEDYAHYWASAGEGEWNDFAKDNSNIDGYVVEYGGMPGDRDVELSDTTTVAVVTEDTEAPTAEAGGDVSTKEGTATVFDGSASTDNVNITSYEWAFGDGERATGATTTHVYDQPGTYEATLTVTDAAGNTARDTITVTVTEVTLIAKTGVAAPTIDAGETLTLDGTSSDSSAGIASYAWDLDDDGETESSTPLQEVSYRSPGEYTTHLTVTDELGNTAGTETTVTVRDATPPSADAGEPRRTVDEDRRITFDASGSTDNSGIVRYEWDFDGDETTDAEGTEVAHTFETPGTYEVTVTVVDEGGNEDTDTQTVEVLDVTDPVADAGEDVVVDQSEVVTGDASDSEDNVGIVQYGWDLNGDGVADRSGQRISGSYDQAGTYRITLMVTDAAGNTDTDLVNATVLDTEPPEAALATDNLTAGTGSPIRFDAGNSTDNTLITTYEWDFGDGTTRATDAGFGSGSGAQVQHTYEDDGEYEVTLTAVDREGNTATDTVTVTILDDSVLVASGGATNATVPAGQELTLDASASEASAGIESYAWDLDGDGETDASGPTHTVTYEEPGNQTVWLTVTDAAGNEATTAVNLTVLDVTPPVAELATEERTIPEDESATFDASASTDNGAIASYEWDFTGDGATDATGAEPDYTFEQPGEYTVVLTVTDEAGNADTTTMTVRVTDGTPPQVVAGDDRTVPQNEPVTLDAGRTDDNGEIVRYEWDVDGDGEAEFTGEEITTEFGEIGAHEVTLTVIDAAGNRGTDTLTVEVTDAIAPIADAGGSISALAGAAVDVDASNSTDNVGVVEYEWDFGDGAPATGETATHAYENDGRYTATLTTRDAAGNEATDTLSVTVVDGSVLIADAGPSRIEADQGESVGFDARTSEGDAPLESYEWDFDGDGETDTAGPTPTHAFEEAGVYTVVLTVTDSAGNIATDKVEVHVADTTAPTASAGVSSSPVDEGTAVAFYGTSSVDNTDIEAYRWDVDGDGVVDATGDAVTHTFEEPGTYTAELTVVDAGGNTATDTVRVVVSDVAPPTVDMGGDVETGIDSTVTFDVRASDNVGIADYAWDLDGDGRTDATGETAQFTYEDDGNYTASVTVRDLAGNTATDSVQVTVINDSVLVADAGPDRTVGPGTTVNFDGTGSESSAGIVGYAWDFDDGTRGASPVTSHAYLDRGTYDVDLTVTDVLGNDATGTATLEVRDVTDPMAAIDADRTAGVGSLVVIDARDSHDDEDVEAYRWHMGDGNVVTTSTPRIAYRYDEAGSYPVTLTVVDGAGNTDTDVAVVDVVEETDDDSSIIQLGTAPSANGTDADEGEDGPLPEGLRIVVADGQPGDPAGPIEATDSQEIVIENAPDDSSLSLLLNDASNTSVDGDRLGNIISDRLDVDIIEGGDFEMTVETREVNLQAVTAATNGSQATQTEGVDGETGAGENVTVAGVDRRTVDMTVRALSESGQAFVNETGARPAGYVQVNHTISEDDVGGATHHFRVRKSYLNATGVGPQAVQLYREEPEEWNDLETTYVGSSGEFHHYIADSPGLSLFTIGAHTPVFEIREAHVVGGTVVTGQPFTVNTTIANVGTVNGTYTARLVADGEVVDTREVDVPANGTRDVQLEHTFDEGGDHTLAIGNLQLESVQVTGGINWLLWLIVPVIVVILLFILWRRRDDEDESEGPLDYAEENQ